MSAPGERFGVKTSVLSLLINQNYVGQTIPNQQARLDLALEAKIFDAKDLVKIRQDQAMVLGTYSTHL